MHLTLLPMTPSTTPTATETPTATIPEAAASAPGPDTSPIERAAALLGTQFGIASRAQLVACGLTVRQVDRRIALGSLQRVARGVYRVAATPSTWEQQAIAAVLATSHRMHPCALSHASAAAAWNLPGFARSGEIQLTATPEDRHPNPLAHITRAIDLEAEDLVVGPLGVRTTTLERTILDLLVRCGSESVRLRMLDGLLADDRVDLETLWGRASQMSGRPGIVAVRRAIRTRVRESRRAEREQRALEARRQRRLDRQLACAA